MSHSTGDRFQPHQDSTIHSRPITFTNTSPESLSVPRMPVPSPLSARDARNNDHQFRAQLASYQQDPEKTLRRRSPSPSFARVDPPLRSPETDDGKRGWPTSVIRLDVLFGASDKQYHIPTTRRRSQVLNAENLSTDEKYHDSYDPKKRGSGASHWSSLIPFTSPSSATRLSIRPTRVLQFVVLAVITTLVFYFSSAKVFHRSASTYPSIISTTPHPVEGGLLKVDLQSQSHPIYQLIRDAREAWDKKMASQSVSLKGAVEEYARRYKRRPPKGFDKWWNYVW